MFQRYPLLRFITIGLALAFVVQLLFPGLFQSREVVEFIDAGSRDAPQIMSSGPVSYADAVAVAAPAVVNIYTRKTIIQQPNPLFNDPLLNRFFGKYFDLQPKKREENSLGSGVILSTKGYILTNNHVIDGADEIEVSLHDGRNASAKLMGSDPEADLALLAISLPNLPTITLADSLRLRIGDVVLAIGNPFGVGQTVTMGIVSATGRNELGINTFENFIQTDAAINPGNSGGALINARGELVGINTAIFSKSGGSQGIGFAIPVNLARDSMTQLVEKGYVARGWLGVEIQEITPELAESFNLTVGGGVIVAGILKGGPADRGGIEPGDILTHFGGIAVHSSNDALNRISQTKPGSRVEFITLRNGKKRQGTVAIGERPHSR
ncbi:MAG: Do family serine endopeptidase [Gammaproteobacteria bacterium]|nr:Do family serine endopeptidase [Gammaproteobacteria bacterium]